MKKEGEKEGCVVGRVEKLKGVVVGVTGGLVLMQIYKGDGSVSTVFCFEV